MNLTHIDIHSHLYFPDYDADRDEVIARMKEQGVGTITIGTTLETSREAVQLAQEHEHLWACVGIHPAHDLTELPAVAEVASTLRTMLSEKKVVAIGECGLDYFRMHADPEKTAAQKVLQHELFEMQVQLSIEMGKPLMLHIRDGKNAATNSAESAHADVLTLLRTYKKEYGDKLRANCHFFSGPVELAKQYLELGFMLSFTGVVTFTPQYNDAIKYVPAGSFMIETDAPFVAPVPHRGKRNEPTYVIEVLKKVAEIRGDDTEVLKVQLLNTAKNFFSL